MVRVGVIVSLLVAFEFNFPFVVNIHSFLDTISTSVGTMCEEEPVKHMSFLPLRYTARVDSTPRLIQTSPQCWSIASSTWSYLSAL